MLMTTVALVAAMGSAPVAPEPGTWRIVRESAGESVAVQVDDNDGGRTTAYVLTTYASPRPRRTGGSYRQLWTELSIKCPSDGHPGFYGEVLSLIAEESVPLPQDDLAPPMALRDFGDNRHGPLALAICTGEAPRGRAIEGDWATVLRALVEHSDASRQR